MFTQLCVCICAEVKYSFNQDQSREEFALCWTGKELLKAAQSETWWR